MSDRGKKNVLGVLVDATDFDAAVDRILTAGEAGRPYGVSALAVHGVVTSALDQEQQYRVNTLDLVTPDGQPVRWALNRLHGVRLPTRVYGPELMLEVCGRAAARGLPVYFYGSDDAVLRRMVGNLRARYPGLEVAGAEKSKFRRMTAAEKAETVARIVGSGAKLAFIGLGCPRQEAFVYEIKDDLQMPTIAVGAAFNYHAGTLRRPPAAIQRAGLEWAYRLAQEPRRLWRRYAFHNTAFVILWSLQWAGLWRPDSSGKRPASDLLFG